MQCYIDSMPTIYAGAICTIAWVALVDTLDKKEAEVYDKLGQAQI